MLSDIVILAALILINGLLSCSELAIISLNTNKLKLKAEDGDKIAVLLLKTKEDSTTFLSTVQIGISLVGLFTGAYAADSFAEPILQTLSGIGISLPLNALRAIVILVITILISYFTLIFGELVPKRLALAKSIEVSSAVIRPISVMAVIFRPFVKILSFSTELVVKFLRIKPAEDDDITEEEIRLMMDASSESGGIDESELEMIHNVFEFDDKTVEEIATHRTELVALPVDSDFKTVSKTVLSEKYSRIPVYEESIDNIIGILYIRDLLDYLLKGEGDFNLRSVVRKPYFVPISKKNDDLFEQMQKDKIHMAVVIDEYGGTIGIVTMEDLIEEIMGNIFDEFDKEERPDIEMIDKNTFIINGTVSLSDVADHFHISLPEDEYDTLSGFFIGQLGRIPNENETPEIEFNDLLFKVYEMDEKRIKTVIVCRIA